MRTPGTKMIPQQPPGEPGRVLAIRVLIAVFALVPLGFVIWQGPTDHATSHAQTETACAVTPTGPVAAEASPSPAPTPVVATPQAASFTSVGGSRMTATPDGHSYWLAKADGGVA